VLVSVQRAFPAIRCIALRQSVGIVFPEIACGINILLLGSTCPVIAEKTRPTGLEIGFQFAGAQTGEAKSIRYI
jgi:hypothetical protein